MTDTITIFSPELEEAIRTEASASRLRLDPDADLALLHAELAKQGNTLKLTENGLTVEGANTITARDVLLAASKHETLKNQFVTAGGRITHLDQLSKDPAERARQANAFINEHGTNAWGKLVNDSMKPALRPDVIISAGMSCDDWKNLTQKEKVRAISAWGDSADSIVSKIIARKGGKK